MYALWFPLLFGQCGAGGCSLPSGWEQPAAVHRTGPSPATLHIELVPPDGRVWLDDYAVKLTGGKAHLQTPPLAPGRLYQYRVTARWGEVERQWILRFSPGETVRVVLRHDEPAPSTSGSTAGTRGSSIGSPSPPASTAPDRASHVSPPGASKPEGQLPVVEQDGVQNFGIDRSRLNGSAERIMLDGREITPSEAARILQAGSLADDSGKLRLTVIGTEADRRRVLDDLKGPLADIAAQCLVQDYPPDHWAVAGAGFYTAGKPTIYVQAPDGKVLHRQDDYADGAEGFRQAFERLRKPDPNYRPDKDRDLRRPANGWLSRLIDIVVYPFRVILLWLLAAGMVFVLIVLAMKGWLSYLVVLLASLVPGPPARAKTASTAQSQARKRRSARRSRS